MRGGADAEHVWIIERASGARWLPFDPTYYVDKRSADVRMASLWRYTTAPIELRVVKYTRKRTLWPA